MDLVKKKPQKLEDVTIPVFEGSFVEYNDSIDDPTPSPRFLKSMQYSRGVLSASPSPDRKSRKNRDTLPKIGLTTGLKESRAERERRLAHRVGGSINDRRAARYEAKREALMSGEKAVDLAAVEASHQRKKMERRQDDMRGQRRRTGQSLGRDVLPTSPPIHPDDQGELSPMKIVEAGKEASRMGRPVDPKTWGHTSPPVTRGVKTRRNAI